MNSNIINKIFSIRNDKEFRNIALDIFKFQAKNNSIYKSFLHNLNFNVDSVREIEEIPFLPINLFKSHKIVTGEFKEGIKFYSSGTGGTQSTHYIKNLNIYEKSFTKGFEYFYGKIEDYTIIALLPSYLERDGSSLIYMIGNFIKKSNDKRSDFFLNNYNKLIEILEELKKENKKTLFLGVSFGLLDFIEKNKISLGDNFTVMETGGMKGKRKEIIREELHKIFCNSFEINNIHSEYGMTELLSQAYSKKNGIFGVPKWMKIMIRDINNPIGKINTNDRNGKINVIDLANLYSCSFIATEDIGKLYDNGQFEILGRMDNTDIRGCNLMVSDL